MLTGYQKLNPTAFDFNLIFIFVFSVSFPSEMKGIGIESVTDSAVSIVTANLQLVLLLEEWRPLCLRHVSMASRIARLMCVFLTG